MDKGQMHIFIGIVYEYGDLLIISDYDFKIGGRTLLTHIYYNEDEDKLQFFAGDIFEDKHAEEVFPTDAELDEIFNIVVNDF